MNSEFNLKILQQASVWAEQLKIDPSFTDSDVEELKCHLIDIVEDLTQKGLDEEEAFMIAASRLGDTTYLKCEFENVNSPVIQMHKTILVLSGILVYFSVYFLMIFSTRLLVLLLYQIKDDPEQNIRYLFYEVTVFHLFLIISTLLLLFRGNKVVNKIAGLKINPRHTFMLFAGIISLAIADQWLSHILKGKFEPGCYTYNHLHTLFDYSGYTFPLVTIICFIVLLKKYYPVIIEESNIPELSNDQWTSNASELKTNLSIRVACEEQLNSQSTDQRAELNEKGLDEDEIQWVLLARQGLIFPQGIDHLAVCKTSSQMRLILMVFSGVLIYFFLYFFLYSTARIFFAVLQHIDNDPLLNIKRTWSYVLIFQSVFIFLTASLYVLDKNLVQRIKQIRIKPSHTLWIFLATIALAITDRCFYPISGYSLNPNRELVLKFGHIFLYSNYSFPFILGACLLVLFYKYYRDNIRN